MTPHQCRVPHRPEEGKYGDCLRACVASVFDYEPEEVPHFARDGAAAEVVWQRLQDWLYEQELTAFTVQYPPEPLDDLLDMMGTVNPAAVYLLTGGTGEGDHVVVCRGGKIIHNPAWVGCSLIQPGSAGCWQITVFSRI